MSFDNAFTSCSKVGGRSQPSVSKKCEDDMYEEAKCTAFKCLRGLYIWLSIESVVVVAAPAAQTHILSTHSFCAPL